MALGCRTTKSMGMGAVVVCTVTLWLMFPLWAHAVVEQDQHLSRVHIDSTCPPQFTYVYPYGSDCTLPARFFTEEFHLYHVSGSLISGLEPEWDEANSTYYMRLASTSANYTVLYNLSAAGGIHVDSVYQNFPSLLQNTESKRYLTWREEGANEHFLIETDTFDEAATFWFFQDRASVLPCILLPGVRCEAYNLMTLPPGQRQPVAGWLLYEESGVNYIKLAAPQSVGHVPILLTRISTNIGAIAAASAVIRTST